MFEQLPEWHSKISFRLALVNAIGFGFTAGMGFGILVLKAVLLHATRLELLEYLLYLAISIGAAIRFCFLSVSRAKEQRLAGSDLR